MGSAIAFQRGARRGGFTLLELMITVAVISILAAVAIPSYGDYVTRSRIIDATTKLGDFRTRMEKYFFDNRTYVDGAKCGVADPPVGGGDHFRIDCAAAPESYTVTATGLATRGMGGFTYTVDQANRKATTSVPAGWAGMGNACWVLRRDGAC